MSATVSLLPKPERSRGVYWALPAWLLLLVVAWFCYRPGLGGPPLLDDQPQLGPLLDVMTQANWRSLAPDFLFSVTGPGGRPVALLSFILSVAVHGPVLAMLKRDNVMLHLICGCLVFAWLWMLSHRTPAGPRAQRAVVLLAGLWLLHPLLVSTTLYTIQRMAMLSALFTFAGLIAYLSARTRHATGQPGAGPRLAICFLVCLPLAFLSKENGILLIPLCAAQEWLLFRDTGNPEQKRLIREIFGLLLVLPLALACTALAPAIFGDLQAGYLNREFTPAERLLTEARVLVLYLREWWLPDPAALSFFHDEIMVSHSVIDPPTTLAALLLLAAISWAAWRQRRAWPLFTLGWCVFLIGHALESTIVPLELAFEHRNYAPSAGLALMLLGLPWGDWVRQRVPTASVRRLVLAFPLLLLLVLAVLTAQRSATWGDANVLYPALFAANPDSPRLAAIFAENFAAAGQFDDAVSVLKRQHTLGAALQRVDIACQARRTADRDALAGMLRDMRGIVTGYETRELVLISNDVLEQRCGLGLPWGVAMLDHALALRVTTASSRALLFYYRAQLHRAAKAPQLAQDDLAAATAADAANPLPLLMSATWALDDGDSARAEVLYRHAAGVHGIYRAAYADLLAELGRRLGHGVQ